MTYINAKGERFVTTTILLPTELHARAKRAGVNMSALVRATLTDYLDAEGAV